MSENLLANLYSTMLRYREAPLEKHFDTLCEAYDAVNKDYCRLQKEVESSQWIAVETELPEKTGEYLVTGESLESKKRFTFNRDYLKPENAWKIQSGWKVIAWQNLPEPFTEVKQ